MPTIGWSLIDHRAPPKMLGRKRDVASDEVAGSYQGGKMRWGALILDAVMLLLAWMTVSSLVLYDAKGVRRPEAEPGGSTSKLS